MLKKIPQNEWHQSQRGYFAGALYNAMIDNKKIWLIVGDLGYGVFDKIKSTFPKRFLNTGASEQAATGICVGLALEGLIPFFYSITTFLLYRPFETIRNYVNHEQIPVRLVGSGRDKDYAHDGFSHWSEDAEKLFQGWGDAGQLSKDDRAIFHKIKPLWPEVKEKIPTLVKQMVKEDKPWFISLRR